jgi:vacuolar-type H+-ATPase subunit F/Vma7
MKPIIVASGDLTDGFRLAGIPVYELDEESQIPDIIDEIFKIEDAGIVLVDERYMEHFEKAFLGRELPMIASFPAEEVEREESYIDELTLRFLGQRLHVEGDGT